MRTGNPVINTPRWDQFRSVGVFLLLAIIAMGLSACGGSNVPPGTTNTEYGQTTYGQSTSQGNIRATRPVVRRKPEISAAGPMIPFKPIPSDTLKGLSEDAVEAKIGAPEMVRGEGEIRVWQYRSEQCSFDAFFVPKTEGDPRELRHMLARMRRGNQEISVQDCLDEVLKLHLASK